ncbi:MAG: type II toxin-antitoxin system death-on-curing family toxin [Pleurocapsa sp.]
MSQIKFITLAVAKAVHDQQLTLFGGTTGLIDEGKLESALFRPINIANYNPDASLADLAAALGYGIAINHLFVDGNKRTAFIVMAVFLEINQVKLTANEVDVVEIMLGIASGTVTEQMLSSWLEQSTGSII